MNTKRINKIAMRTLSFGALVAIAIYLGLWWLSRTDTLDLKFSSHREVATAGLIERGIVPSFLPMSASEIHVDANLDGGGVVVTFAFGPDFDAFLEQQKQSPGVTPKSLGINGQHDGFSIARELRYIPKVSSTDASSTGHLLVNPKKRRAMYVKAAFVR